MSDLDSDTRYADGQTLAYIADLEAQVAELTRERDELERLYGSEFNMNNELIGVRSELRAALDAARKEAERQYAMVLEGASLLAAAQARNVELRKALNSPFMAYIRDKHEATYKISDESDFPQHDSGIFLDAVAEALSTPDDTAALDRALAAERERCANVCADHPGHIPSNKWNASSALGSCEQAIRSLK